MNIIEKFYILFKSDASEVKKGADEAKKATLDLDNSLKNVNKGTEKVGASFLELAKAGASFLGVAAAIHEVFSGITGANDYALSLGDASRAFGINAAELDVWGNAVKRTGGTVESFQSALRGLSQHFGASEQVALAVLPKLADVFQRLGRFRALQYGKILGLDEPTILLLLKGRREIESIIERQRELGTVTNENIDNAQKYRIAQNDLATAFRSLYLTLGNDVIPVLSSFYEFLVPPIEYLKRHTNLVIGAFIGIGAAAAIMLAPFIIAGAEIILVTVLIGAAIAAFALLFEDIEAFRNGQKSLIGLLLEKWPIIGTVIKTAFQGLKGILDIALSPLFAAEAAAKYLASFFAANKDVTLNIESGQNLLNLAGTSPINAQTTNSNFYSRSFGRNNHINTGPITINTQAHDAVGLAAVLGKTLNDQFAQTANNFSDGVLM
jgi:hypothetical protein